MKALHVLLPALLMTTCASARAQTDPLAAMAWLAGCWEQTGREPGSVEQWTAPAGGLMLGMSRLMKGGRVAEFEFMQIRADADGQLSFIAQPQGRPPTAFKLLRQTEAESVFENTAHDFPQRIRYRRDAADRLTARVEGLFKGQERGIDFPMQRGTCP